MNKLIKVEGGKKDKKLFSNVRLISFIYLLIVYIMVITGGTYAYVQLSSGPSNATGRGCFNVLYSGNEITSASLTSTTDYQVGSTNTTITLSKDPDCLSASFANIYITTRNTTTAPVATNSALKYKMFRGNTLVTQGSINKIGKQFITSVELTSSPATYTIYVYLDSTMSKGLFNNTSYSGFISAESTQTSTIPTATFLTGSEVNVKMKNLAGDNVSAANTYDTNITSILKSSSAPDSGNMTADNVVSTSGSDFPIYMWYSNHTIYWWSIDEKPNLNSDASQMFRQFSNLTNVSGLADFDASTATNFQTIFANNLSMTDYSPIAGWDTSNVTSLKQSFQCNTSLLSLSPLANWNTSNVTTMHGTFMCSNTTGAMHISSLAHLSNWNVSKVQTMQAMFQLNLGLSTLTGLENWDVSSVTNMQSMFLGNSTNYIHISSLTALANWNTSSLENMTGMFEHNDTLTSLKGLGTWNVSSVSNYTDAFRSMSSLTSTSAINDWNINSSATFTQMFGDTPVHPDFYRVSGTWNSSGTFTPS